MAACATHTRREAVSACVRCSRSLCADCIVHTNVGFKCASCTGTVSPRASRLGGGRLPLVALIAVVAVAAVVTGVRLAGAPSSSEADAAAVSASADRLAVTFAGEGEAHLTGVLDLPADRAEPVPGVVVVPGFGPTRRDGIAPDGVVRDPLYRDLGDALAAAGFAVLRYDKRGTGGSQAGQDDGPLTFEQLAADADAAAGFLRKRPEVKDAPVALVGHDEGGLIGLRLAGAGSDLAAVVLVSTPGRPLVEVVGDEIRAGGLMATGEQRRQLAAELETAVSALLDDGEVPPVSRQLRGVLPRDRAEYLTSIFRLDPVELAATAQLPVLLVHGEQDPGIKEADVTALVEALPEAAEVEVLARPDADHTLRLTPEHGHDGAATRAERDREALRRIAAWLRQQTFDEST